VDELPPGTRKFLTIDERPIAIFNIKGEFFGLLNRCPHQGAALCEGPLIGLAQSSIRRDRIYEVGRNPPLSRYGWEFDIRTGQSYCIPSARAYPVNVAGRQRGEGAVCGDIGGVGGERLRGGDL
jgi:3-phenylpropionate/trans-cinnamate dioxygenase ferredoxin subunit